MVNVAGIVSIFPLSVLVLLYALHAHVLLKAACGVLLLHVEYFVLVEYVNFIADAWDCLVHQVRADVRDVVKQHPY